MRCWRAGAGGRDPRGLYHAPRGRQGR